MVTNVSFPLIDPSFIAAPDSVKSIFAEVNGDTAFTNRLNADITALQTSITTAKSAIDTEVTAAGAEKTALEVLEATPPASWTTGGYTAGDITSIIATLDTWITTITGIQTSINTLDTEVTTFKAHSDRLSGEVFDPPGATPPPNVMVLYGISNAASTISHALDVPVDGKDYFPLLFGSLYTAPTTLQTIKAIIDTSVITPITGVSLDPTTEVERDPPIVTTAVTDIQASINETNSVLSASAIDTEKAKLTTHMTNDDNEYDNAINFIERSSIAFSIDGWAKNTYSRFTLEDVIASNTLKTILDTIQVE